MSAARLAPPLRVWPIPNSPHFDVVGPTFLNPMDDPGPARNAKRMHTIQAAHCQRAWAELFAAAPAMHAALAQIADGRPPLMLALDRARTWLGRRIPLLSPPSAVWVRVRKQQQCRRLSAKRMAAIAAAALARAKAQEG